MYCVRCERFQFNPDKVSSIEEAYNALSDYKGAITNLFDSLEEAKEFVSGSADFHGYDRTHAHATVYVIEECDWFFEEDYYRNVETGEIERTFADLEMLGSQYIFADEASFKSFKYGAALDTTDRDFDIIAEVTASVEFNHHGHICRYDGDLFFVESDRDNQISAPMYDSFETCAENLCFTELDDLTAGMYVKDVGYKTLSAILAEFGGEEK